MEVSTKEIWIKIKKKKALFFLFEWKTWRTRKRAPQKCGKFESHRNACSGKLSKSEAPSFCGAEEKGGCWKRRRWPVPFSTTPRPSFHATMASVPRQKAKHPKYWRKSYCPPLLDRTLKCGERKRERESGRTRAGIGGRNISKFNLSPFF